jgi:alpha-tubulin suppressor-like RCC1 family protein
MKTKRTSTTLQTDQTSGEVTNRKAVREPRKRPATTPVAAGMVHSLYITTDGKLYAMGNNDFGQLGDGTSGFRVFKATPVLIAEGVASVAAGGVPQFIYHDGRQALRNGKE